MDDNLRDLLRIPTSRLEEINAVLLDPNMIVINDFLEVVAKFGTPQEINRKAAQAREMPALRKRVEETHPEYLADLDWLIEQRDAGKVQLTDQSGFGDYIAFVQALRENAEVIINEEAVTAPDLL